MVVALTSYKRLSKNKMLFKKFLRRKISPHPPASSERKMSQNSFPPQLVQFYDPTLNALDEEGRTLSSILAWPDSKLEQCHDYIQQIFPLPEKSLYNPSAPIISLQIFSAFRQRADLRGQLRKSFIRILSFYGLEHRIIAVDSGRIEDALMEIVKAPNFDTASRRWVNLFDHNHLRITRIIRCLRVLGLEQEAEAFFLTLASVYDSCGGKISKRSLTFWTRAAKRPLWLAPEVNDTGEPGKGFLWEFEEGRKNKVVKKELEGETADNDIEEASSPKNNGADVVPHNTKSSQGPAPTEYLN